MLIDEKLDVLQDARVGLLCNQASVLPDLRHAADVLSEHADIRLTALFGPQHGIRGDVQDNMIETDHSIDPLTGLPVHSLYSETRIPTEAMLGDVDVIVCDLQDVGCRIYTFIYTIANCMIAAKEFGKKIIVCDRPNPIGGIGVAGNVTEKAFTSFVGQYEIPTRHGMTAGELATMFNDHFGIGCDLEVIRMDGWERGMWFDDTGLPFVLPSPNIPTPDTCTVFPATVLLEGTEISEGRGTTKPFELNGAPYIDPYAWRETLDGHDLEGVVLRPTYFQPTFQKWAKQTCGGLQIHVTDREVFDPVTLGIAMVKAAHDLYPNDFEWKREAYEYEFGKNAFDVVTGTDKIRKAIESGTPLEDIVAGYQPELRDFITLRERFLLY